MTPPPPPAEPTGGRAAAARLAQLEHDLLAPVHAVRDLAAMLQEDAQANGPPALVADLVTAQAVSAHLEDLVHELVAALARTPPPGAAEFARLRHDLRTPLNQILGYCDLWLDEADPDEAAASAPLRPDLERLRAAARDLLARLDALRDPAHSGDDRLTGSARALLEAAPAARPPAAPGRLLVVDDNSFNRDVLCRRLERHGHTVAQAADGSQALDRLAREPFDLVLLDLLMPGMSGLEVLARLRADDRLRLLPVIIISALTEIQSVARGLEAGADDYLPRPFNGTILQARIGALLERKRLLDREQEYLRRIEAEKERADALLHVILPAEAVHELQATGRVAPRRFENVAVLFADLVGFTPYCDAHPAEEVVPHLQRLVERFEEVALACGVQKIKTIGDSFMAAAGLLRPSASPVLDCVRCGLGLVAAAAELPPGWQVRVGIHIGAVMGGVVGRRQYLFDIWGDAVNTAARVESKGEPGAVTLTLAAWQQVADICRGTSRGCVDLKGKGSMELIRVDEVA